MALTTIPASLSATALTLTTAAQPNITSVGTLTGLTMSGNLTVNANTNITGNLTVDTNSFYVDATNNRVGIGTTSPAEVLQVAGGIKTTGGFLANTANSVGISYSSGFGHFISWGADGSTKGAYKFTGSASDGSPTADYMVIDSSGNVGIGTTSPADALHILDTSGHAYASVARSTQSQGEVGLRLRGGTSGNDWYIYQKPSNNNLNFYNTSDRMTIDSSGNVGIGTTPSGVLSSGYVLRLNGGTQTFLAFNNTTHTTQATGGFAIGHDASSSYIIQRENQPLDFYTNNVFRVRITSSGSLLVGKTSGGNTNTAGFEVQSNGFVGIAAAGIRPLQINRQTDNGDIIEFRKDGTTVGSIGSYVGLPYIGKSDVNLLFDPAGPHVIPRGSAGGGRDGAINLGQGTNRFKDLYLSGGAYLGGTGTANKLDDYEEGTWTPTIVGSSGASGQSYNIQNGYYTKIGSFVHYTFDVSLTTAGTFSGSYVVIGGLPFAGLGGNLGGTANIGYNTGIGGNLPLGAYISGSNVYLMEQGTSGSDYILVSENKIGNTGRLIGSLLVYTSN